MTDPVWPFAAPVTGPVAWGRPEGVDDSPVPPAMRPHPVASSPAGPGPLAPAGAETAPPTTTGSLGGIFDDPSGVDPEPTPAPVVAADLAGLFGDATPVSTPDRGPLAGLFEDDTPAAATERPGDDLGGLFDDPVPAPDQPAPAPEAPVAAAAPSASGAEPPPASGPPDAAGLSRLETRRQATAAAHAADPRPVRSEQSEALAREARYTRAAELQPLVDRVLGLGGGGDTELQAMLKSFELTRDHARDRAQRAAYQKALEPLLASHRIPLHSEADRDTIFDIAYDEVIGIGPLGPLWRDDTVSEILVSGPDRVTVERRGRLEITPVRFTDINHLERVARNLAQESKDDRAISKTNPLVTIQLPGARVQFVWRPLAVNRVAIAIRKFGALMDMNQLLRLGALSEDMAAFLRDCVRARATVLVSGGTGSGKTTFINALSEFIPDSERVVTIEDALELQLRNTHVEALVTKEAASGDDRHLFGQDALLKASLRLRPDRIIVGEIRDGAGCAVMLEAANTGHSGTMTTIHANAAHLALSRMSKLLRRADPMADEVARGEVATAIDVVVQLTKSRDRKFVADIAVVDADSGETTSIFTGSFPLGAGAPAFAQAHPLGPDTELARKMVDAGCDPRAWERG